MTDRATPPPQPQQGTVFLARASYVQRRLRDAARMLPVFGAILLVFPLLSEGALTARVGVFIFGVWMFLIGLSALISTRITDDAGDVESPDRANPAAD